MLGIIWGMILSGFWDDFVMILAWFWNEFGDDFGEDFFKEDREFHIVLEFPEDIKEQIGSGSLIIELEVNTRAETGWIENISVDSGVREVTPSLNIFEMSSWIFKIWNLVTPPLKATLMIWVVDGKMCWQLLG